MTAGYGLLGFLDDYAKVTKQTTAGISGRLRLVLESVDRHGAPSALIILLRRPAAGDAGAC